MSNFTKTLVAATITGLISTSALASEGGGLNGVYATAQNKQAKIDFTGSNCSKEKVTADATFFYTSFNGIEGSNTGEWDSTLFNFGLEGDGEGPYIASKPNKTLVMDLDGGTLFDFEWAIDDYVFDNCDDEDGYNFDTLVKKFETKISKNGDKVNIKMDAEGTYYNTKKDKDRNVKVKLNAKANNVD